MEREPLPRFCQHKSRVGNTLILQLDWDQPKTEIHCFKATSIKVGEAPTERPSSPQRCAYSNFRSRCKCHPEVICPVSFFHGRVTHQSVRGL